MREGVVALKMSAYSNTAPTIAKIANLWCKFSPMRYILLSNFLNKIWREEAVPGPHPYAKFHRCGFKNVSYLPQKLPEMVIFGINLPLTEMQGVDRKT